MTRYLHVYRAPSGEWAGMVLEEVAGIAGCEHPLDVLIAAREQFPDIEDLPADATANMRADGEPLTGHDEIDFPDDDEPPPCVQEAMRWRG